MANLSPTGLDQGHLLLGQVNRMGQDHLGRQQACRIIHVGVRLAFGKQLLHKRHLGLVLGDVRLAVHARLAVQVAQRTQTLAGAARGEAGRDDRRDELGIGVNLLDVVDGGLGVSDAVLDAGVAVVVRRQRVHAHAADEGALALFEADVGEQVG